MKERVGREYPPVHEEVGQALARFFDSYAEDAKRADAGPANELAARSEVIVERDGREHRSAELESPADVVEVCLDERGQRQRALVSGATIARKPSAVRSSRVPSPRQTVRVRSPLSSASSRKPSRRAGSTPRATAMPNNRASTTTVGGAAASDRSTNRAVLGSGYRARGSMEPESGGGTSLSSLPRQRGRSADGDRLARALSSI